MGSMNAIRQPAPPRRPPTSRRRIGERKAAAKPEAPDSARDRKQPYAIELEAYSGDGAMRPPEAQIPARRAPRPPRR